MVGRINRRRVRKRKSTGENSRMKFILILVIMVAAIGLGYLTARFVIGPLLGYNADESPIAVIDKDKDKEEKKSEKAAAETAGESKEDQKDTDEEKTETAKAPEDGFALQFGVFSSKESAQKLAESLKEKGIEAKIVEDGDNYKVISNVVDTKEKAIAGLDDIKDKEVEDVFIASF